MYTITTQYPHIILAASKLQVLAASSSAGNRIFTFNKQHRYLLSVPSGDGYLVISDTASMSAIPENLYLHVLPVITPFLFSDYNFYPSNLHNSLLDSINS